MKKKVKRKFCVFRFIEKYPEIKQYMKLQGDRLMVLMGIMTWCLHILTGYLLCTYVKDRFIRAWLTYAIGTWFATALKLHIHEAIHGLAFGVNHVWKNHLYGHFLNLVLAGPFFPFFRRKHKNHHKFIGDEGERTFTEFYTKAVSFENL